MTEQKKQEKKTEVQSKPKIQQKPPDKETKEIVPAEPMEIQRTPKEIEDRIQELIEKLRKPFAYLSEEDYKDLDLYLSPEKRMKAISDSYFMERISKQHKLSEAVDEATNKLRSYIQDEDLKVRDLAMLTKVLSDVEKERVKGHNEYNRTTVESLIEKAKAAQGQDLPGGFNLNQQFNIGDLDSKQQTVLEKFKGIEPSKLERILRLSEKILAVAKKKESENEGN